MTAWVCTHDGCDQPAAARVAVPLLPYPAGTGLGFAVVYPLTVRAGSGTGMPYCIQHAHHVVDVMLMHAQSEAAT